MADTYDPTTSHSTASRVSGAVRAAVSYTLFGLGIAALVSFFAASLGAEALAWHTGLLPTIAAPTEGDAVVNVSPLISGVVASSVAVWLR